MDNNTASILTNLALELNATLRKVKNLQQKIDLIHKTIHENSLLDNFLQIARDHNCSEIINNNIFSQTNNFKRNI
ncbi:TPA: hypothetical protein ACX8VE_001486 [Campylobacter jejuni]|nr:hypothetical protein [Campylobacter jejuni]